MEEGQDIKFHRVGEDRVFKFRRLTGRANENKDLVTAFNRLIMFYAMKMSDALKLLKEFEESKKYIQCLILLKAIFDLEVEVWKFVGQVYEYKLDDISAPPQPVAPERGRMLIFQTTAVVSVWSFDRELLLSFLTRLERHMNQTRNVFDNIYALVTINSFSMAFDSVARRIASADRARASFTRYDYANTNAQMIPGFDPYMETVEEAEQRVQARAKEAGELSAPPRFSTKVPKMHGQPFIIISTEVTMTRESLLNAMVEQKPLIPVVGEMSNAVDLLGLSASNVIEANSLQDRVGKSASRLIMMIVCPKDKELTSALMEAVMARAARNIQSSDLETRVFTLDASRLLNRVFSMSEKRFTEAIQWFIERAEENGTKRRYFDILWIANTDTLFMDRTRSRQGVSDASVFVNIVSAMLEMMDNFNKSKSMANFMLLFGASDNIDVIDAAFRRRVENIYTISLSDQYADSLSDLEQIHPDVQSFVGVDDDLDAAMLLHQLPKLDRGTFNTDLLILRPLLRGAIKYNLDAARINVSTNIWLYLSNTAEFYGNIELNVLQYYISVQQQIKEQGFRLVPIQLLRDIPGPCFQFLRPDHSASATERYVWTFAGNRERIPSPNQPAVSRLTSMAVAGVIYEFLQGTLTEMEGGHAVLENIRQLPLRTVADVPTNQTDLTDQEKASSFYILDFLTYYSGMNTLVKPEAPDGQPDIEAAHVVIQNEGTDQMQNIFNTNDMNDIDILVNGVAAISEADRGPPTGPTEK